MNLDEAVQHLAKVEITAKSYPGTNMPIRGGTRFTTIEEGTLVHDLFRIEREKHLWLVTIFQPDAHIIHASQDLQNAVYALENLYKLTQRQEDSYHDVTFALVYLQHKGFIATVASTLDRPAILAVYTQQDNVEDRFEFMLHHSLIGQAEDTIACRIYPYHDEWAVDSPNPDDRTPLKIAPDIKTAAEFLIDLSGKRADNQ